MRTSFVATLRRQNRPSPSGATLLLGGVFIVGVLFYLWSNFAFARYALTAFYWDRATGIVTSSGPTDHPTIQFESSDGVSHYFSEDYFALCGTRVPCAVRSFQRGEVVPVVYDPARPERAFIRDWALFVNVFAWLFILGFVLLVLAFSTVLKNAQISLRIGNIGMDDALFSHGETDRLQQTVLVKPKEVVISEVIAKAVRDHDYKQRLLSYPRETLNEAGLELDRDAEVEVIQDTSLGSKFMIKIRGKRKKILPSPESPRRS